MTQADADTPNIERSEDPASEEEGAAPITLSGHLHHFRWDLDKTYLQTDFDSLGALVRTFRQRAEDKVVVPGARRLLQELLHADSPSTPRRVTFVSGSPRQMRKVLTERLRLDGIQPANFILKPNLSNVLRLRLRAVRGQVGYKLEALLRSRIYADEVQEIFFGDDAEQDAFIYSLYADVVAGVVTSSALEAILHACRTYPHESRAILRHLEGLRPQHGKVGRIFIHLERRSPTRRFNAYGPRVVPVFNWFQAAALLFSDGLLTQAALVRVLRDMDDEGYTPLRIANSLQDLHRRGFLDTPLLMAVCDALGADDESAWPRQQAYAHACRHLLETLPDTRPAPPAHREPLDYLSLVSHTRFRREPLHLPRLRFLE